MNTFRSISLESNTPVMALSITQNHVASVHARKNEKPEKKTKKKCDHEKPVHNRIYTNGPAIIIAAQKVKRPLGTNWNHDTIDNNAKYK